jgi:hypothetical protein
MIQNDRCPRCSFVQTQALYIMQWRCVQCRASLQRLFDAKLGRHVIHINRNRFQGPRRKQGGA